MCWLWRKVKWLHRPQAPPYSVRYLKMKVIDDLKKETINKAVKELASGVQEVDTDHSISYVELKDFVPKNTTLR